MAIPRLDQFGRPILATVDGAPVSNPWAIVQQSLLRRTPAPAVNVRPPIAALPTGILQQLRDAPIIGDPGIIFPGAFSSPAAAPPAAAPRSVPSSSGSSSSSGGCFMCSAMGTGAAEMPAVAASVTAPSSGGGVATASLLTGSSSDVPWWWLVLGAAAAGWALHKFG